jgi:hypothetical protein
MTPEGNIQSSDGLDQFSFSEGEEKEVPIVYKDYVDIFCMLPYFFVLLMSVAENRSLLDRVGNLLGQFSNNKHEEVSEFALTFQQLLFRGPFISSFLPSSSLTDCSELGLSRDEFEARSSPWGSRNDFLIIMSYVKDFEAALKDFVRSGKYVASHSAFSMSFLTR